MKTFVTFPAATATSRTIRQTKAAEYRLASKRSLLRRFQHFIESTDWEERYLCNHRIDKMCLGGIMISFLYFTACLLSFVLK